MAVTWIAFHLTDRCQLDCTHCLRDPDQKPKDLPLSLIRRVLSEAKAVYHTSQVALTGGEPTLHPEIAGVIDAVADHDMTWHIVTNGKRFPVFLSMLKKRPIRLEKLTVVDFSLDGADEPTHDDIRGKGSYREVMAGAMQCAFHKIPFVFQMVVNAKNVHQIEQMGLLASQLEAARVSFSMLQPTGTHHDKDLYLSAQAWRDVEDRICRLSAALKMPVGVPEGFYREQPFHVCAPFRSEELHVDVEGRLTLCCQHSGVPSDGRNQDIAGDLHRMSLHEAHAVLLGIIHKAQADRLATIATTPLGEWDHFPCNACMKYFGKPHWTEDFSAGPPARRERWRGAWAQKNSLPLVK